MDLTSSHAESHNEPSNRTQKNHSHIKTISEAQQLYYANHHNSPQNHSLKNSQLHYSLVVDKDSFQDSIARQRVLETEEDQARPSKLNNLTVSDIIPSHKSTNFVESSTRSGYLLPKKIPHHEEKFFKETYYGTLDQPSAFRKKEGYFTDFADSSKVINEDYKNKKQPSLGQSRYLSRPIMFTTINSKNRLSTLNPADLSQLSDIKEINNTMGHSPKSSQFFLDKRDRVKSNVTAYQLPALDTGRSIEKDKNYFPPISQLNSTEASPNRKTTKIILSKNSPTIKSMKTHESLSSSKLNDTMGRGSEIYSAYTRTLGNESPSKMSQLRSRTKSPDYSDIQSPKLMQTMTKYHTKKLVDNLVNDYETKTRLKSDPFKFLEGNNEVKNLRQSNIAIHKINSDVKFSRNHPGRTLSYMREPKKHIYREGDAMEQLHKFEENILGWAKSVPNFGKQRWTYDSAWEFRLI